MAAVRSRLILHVTECYGGGVESMIRRYAAVAPDARHILLWNARRTQHPGDPVRDGVYDDVLALPEGHAAAVREVRRVARGLDPDVIHAHSSFGGAYARLVCGADRRLRSRVAYTPHGLAVDDAGRTMPKRLAFLAAEVALSLAGGTFVGCSPREDRLLGLINPFVPRHPLPNGLVGGEIPDMEWSPVQPPEVGIAARITAVRRPEMFADIVRRVRAERPDVRFTWIGDGPEELRTVLEDAGVEVTGWAAKDEVLHRMANFSVYLHSASQDGFPVSVLEAFSIGVPVLVPGIAAFEDAPTAVRYSDAGEAAAKVVAALDDPGAVLSAWEPIRRRHAPEAFATAVRSLYGLPTEAAA